MEFWDSFGMPFRCLGAPFWLVGALVGRLRTSGALFCSLGAAEQKFEKQKIDLKEDLRMKFVTTKL